MQETQVWSPGWENPLVKEMAIHSNIFAWIIPWTEEPGELQSMESKRVGHNWATKQQNNTGWQSSNIQGAEELVPGPVHPPGSDQSWWLESVPVSKKCALYCSLEPYMGVGSMGRWLRLALAFVTSYLDGKSTSGHLVWEVWVFYLCRNSWKQCVALQIWALLSLGNIEY